MVFNRPDVTAQVFQEIRKARPKHLFVAADGPRAHVEGESERCRQVREIFNNIDWDCNLRTRFLEQNQGCGKAVSGAITWYFDHVEKGIILEDDCLPDPTFFSFCQTMLDRYQDDPRIMLVSGCNFQNGKQRGDGSYYFSKLAHIWGWATWRRVWKAYDFRMSTYPEYARTNAIRHFHGDPAVQAHFTKIFEMMHGKPIDTWDYQLFFKIVEQQGLCINPNVNLVTNIGFGPEATHTFDSGSQNANIPRSSLPAELVHPRAVKFDAEADNYSLKNVMGVQMSEPEVKPISKLVNWIAERTSLITR
jgi:hypothetical protein